MQKLQKGLIEERVNEARERLLAAVNGLDEPFLRREGAVNGWSLAEFLGYLAVWGEEINLGLREIQRRKKPTDLMTAIDDHARFQRRAIKETADEPTDEILIRLEDTLFKFEEQMRQLSYDDLNRPKRFRFLGNKPLWPFIANATYKNEEQYLPELESFIARNRNTENAA